MAGLVCRERKEERWMTLSAATGVIKRSTERLTLRRHIRQSAPQARACTSHNSFLRSLPIRRLVFADATASAVPDFLVFARKAANFPWASHALWLFSQMVRWGQIDFSDEAVAIVRQPRCRPRS